jgi:hypothetical protein
MRFLMHSAGLAATIPTYAPLTPWTIEIVSTPSLARKRCRASRLAARGLRRCTSVSWRLCAATEGPGSGRSVPVEVLPGAHDVMVKPITLTVDLTGWYYPS